MITSTDATSNDATSTDIKTDPSPPDSDDVYVDKDDNYPEPSAPDMDDFDVDFPPDRDDDQSSITSSEDFIKKEKLEDFLKTKQLIRIIL